MGLFGALFAGVSGLNSQSNKIGVISNNISNVNTVGYKQGQAAFDTLVVPSGTTAFSPGGVIGTNTQLVNQQGQIAATSSSTDAAISGGGFFIVNTKADGTGDVLFTRSGSFTPDALGNFVNNDGYFLQAYQLDANGNPPTNQNLSNLKTVNVNQSATGTATPTSLLTVAANFDATHAVLAGSGVLASLSLDTTNANNSSTNIIQPTGTNNLKRGDQFQVQVGTSTADVFTYGGFTTGRSVSSGTLTDGGSTADVTGTPTDANQTYATDSVASGLTTNGTNQVSITVPAGEITSGQYTPGNYISISGVTGTVGGLPAADLNGEWLITGATGTTVTFALASGSTPTAATGPTNGGAAITLSNRTATAFHGNVLDANSATDLFFNQNPSSNFSPDSLSFHVAVNGNNFTFTYNAQPQANLGQFDSMNTLVNAINQSTNNTLTASLSSSGQLLISAADADSTITFTNGNVAGNPSATPPLPGVNWTQELGLPSTELANINAGTSLPSTTANHYFNSLQGLANKINTTDPTNLIATLNATGTGVTIDSADPQQTITFQDISTNSGNSLINALQFKGDHGAGLTQIGVDTGTPGGNAIYSTGTLPILYQADDPLHNMSSGAVPPQYTKDITVFDALGVSHVIAMNVAKLGTNTWAVELTAVPASDISSQNNDGQIASGIVKFNGDGTLQSISGQGAINSITQPLQVTWTNGANASNVTVNLGTLDKSDGLIQSAAAFNTTVANQNGSSVGQLTGVNIDVNGFVIESFSNGQTQKAYQIPLASVNNPNGLEAVSGDAYKQTLASGVVNPQLPGTNGVGTLSPSSLEQSNVDLSTQLTDLIVAQQAYGANSKVLTVADSLLQQLDQIIQ